MKKTIIENPIHYFERNPFVVIVTWLLAAAACYWVYDSIFNQNDLRTINPLSFFSVVPASVLLYQAFWFMLNPFVVFYKDRMEIQQSIFHTKQWHFLDLKTVNEVKNGRFAVVFNDDESERPNLIGIKPSHIAPTRETLLKLVNENLKTRSK